MIAMLHIFGCDDDRFHFFREHRFQIRIISGLELICRLFAALFILIIDSDQLHLWQLATSLRIAVRM